MKRRKRQTQPPDETSEELQARLRRFAVTTHEETMRPATVPFPEHVTVLAGALRKVRTGTEIPDDLSQNCGSDPASDDQN